MTGCPKSGLMVWWFVSVMVWEVGCWLRCWGECRRFCQLREGSDDPPPPVRIGASAALADATPRPASRLIRTVVIAMMRRRRETRCMKPKPLHQTPSGINTACLIKFFLSESRAACQCQPCIGLQEPWRKPAVFSTSPVFHPTTRSADNTHMLESAVRRQRVRQLTLRNYARTGRTGGGQACPGGKPCCLPCCVHLPSWAETREVCLYPHRRKCGGGAGGKCRLSWG